MFAMPELLHNDAEVWQHAFMATAAISVLPTLVLPFVPARAALPGSGIQKIMLCFAVGGLLGDVFLHLLPHLSEGGHHHHHGEAALTLGDHDHHDHDHEGHDHDHNGHDHSGHSHGHFHAAGDAALLHPDGIAACPYHKALAAGNSAWEGVTSALQEQSVGLTILAGFLFFFLCERIIHGFAGSRGGTSHNHGQDSAAAHKKDDDLAVGSRSGEKKPKRNGAAAANGPIKLKANGILNLAADALHNFTDGIGIGAAFASGHALGVATTLSTMLHELPHEIGDYAVLVQSGMSRWQAIGAQFMTAIGAFIGTGVGLAVSRMHGAENALLAFTAGGFVYVACVAVLPEVLQSPSGPLQAFGEAMAMCAGVGLMVAVAALEEAH